MIRALVSEGIIVNTIVISAVDDPSTFPALFGVDATVDVTNVVPRPGPGWLWDGQQFLEPEPTHETPQEGADT